MQTYIGFGDATYYLFHTLLHTLGAQKNTTLIGLLILTFAVSAALGAATASLARAKLTSGILPAILAGIVTGAASLLTLAIAIALIDQWIGAQMAGIPLLGMLHNLIH